MKKAIAISLIALIAFNTAGYRIMYLSIGQQHLLHCLHDSTNAELNNTQNNLTKKQSSVKLMIKSVLSDYTQQPLLFDFYINYFHPVPGGLISHSSLPSAFCVVAERPPEQA